MNIIARKLDWYIYETISQKEIVLTEAKKKAAIKILDMNPRRKTRDSTFRTSMGSFVFDA
jgi:hypothetical protein